VDKAKFLPVAEVADIADGDVAAAEICGQALAIYNLGGTFYATEGFCTHGRAHLAEGYVEDGAIECSMHGGKFDIRSGKAVAPPCRVDLKTFPVIIAGGRILVAIPNVLVASERE